MLSVSRRVIRRYNRPDRVALRADHDPALQNYTSVCSAISSASSTSIPSYLTVLFAARRISR
jgi:hypothetical protein